MWLKSCGILYFPYLGFIGWYHVLLCLLKKKSSVMDLLANRLIKFWLFSRLKPTVIWNMISHCIMCAIWQAKNAQIFEGTNKINLWFEAIFPMDFASGQMLWVLLLLVPGLCALVPFIDFLKKKKNTRTTTYLRGKL